MVAVSIDGVLVAPDAARISVFDRGLLHGDGCFEVLRTWGGVARELEAHLDRLYETARFLVLRTMDRAKLNEAVYRTIAAAGATDDTGERRIRIVLTRGIGPFTARLAEVGPGTAIVIVEPLPPQPTEMTLAVVDWPLPRREGRGHKVLSYVDHLIARELARAAGADEAIRLDDDGNVVECASSNLFIVNGETVSTPSVDHGGLPGIVRDRVLALCTRDGIASRVRDLTVRDLRSADELFVTSSLRGVIAVTRLDGVPVMAGPITAQLASAYVAEMHDASSS
ncbi:MAG: aminotransferase class IV [Deltaproteobacteria bacterium]|nr:aminotransferase class IV [Deltaproteobacteria bacterium]MDQ3298907.1 aminotransferase class IV [Myxococcota bacterium]